MFYLHIQSTKSSFSLYAGVQNQYMPYINRFYCGFDFVNLIEFNQNFPKLLLNFGIIKCNCKTREREKHKPWKR